MKILDIAFKDMLRSSRSMSFVFLGLVVPFLMTGLFYLAFGQVALGEGFDLPQTRVQVVNMDQADPALGGFSVGNLLVEFLRSDQLAGLMRVTEAADAAAARSAVDRQQADVAIIIPAGLTEASLRPQGQAAIELYKDPTLVLGPGIVQGIVSQVVDGFAGSKIAAQVSNDLLSAQGQTASPAVLQSLAMAYGNWAAELGASQQTGDNPLFDLRSPAGEEEKASPMVGLIGPMMAGLMVFYLFFTGPSSAQSILQEEESGTLPRLFTTPTPQSIILGGKFLAIILTLILQITVLLVVSALVFDIDWGPPGLIVLVGLAVIIAAAGYGILAISLVRNSRQAGIIIGGAGTLLGMIGMFRAFVAMIPGAPPAINTISLFVPQGWGVYGWQVLLSGGGLAEVMPQLAVLLGLGCAFFALGVLRFQRRFA